MMRHISTERLVLYLALLLGVGVLSLCVLGFDPPAPKKPTPPAKAAKARIVQGVDDGEKSVQEAVSMLRDVADERRARKVFTAKELGDLQSTHREAWVLLAAANKFAKEGVADFDQFPSWEGLDSLDMAPFHARLEKILKWEMHQRDILQLARETAVKGGELGELVEMMKLADAVRQSTLAKRQQQAWALAQNIERWFKEQR